MVKALRGILRGVQRDLSAGMAHPAWIAALPGLCLLLFWLGGQSALIGGALILPVAYLLVRPRAATALSGSGPGQTNRAEFRLQAKSLLAEATEKSLKTAMFKIEIDDHPALVDRYGQAAADRIVELTGQRLQSAVRNGDVAAQTGDFRFSVCLAPVRHLDLEVCLQIAHRMQTALEEPVAIDGLTAYVTFCVGFVQNHRLKEPDVDAWLEATNRSLREAQHHGPGCIRSYSDELRRHSEARSALRDEVASALENGQILAWFQPQISTDTGLVTGFEALARWSHPEHGMIPPATFLPAIDHAGLLERLAEVMMQHAFAALKAWDAAGLSVRGVGVNFAGPELNNPRLLDKVRWELDRFDLAPERLVVEVLETVMANAPDDIVTRNITGLGALGCRIDLDDFGTGHASIASIRRFAVSRIKIDRSFVMKSDRDPEQQRMISAILTMAERLGIETLAEGVETVGEHALLAQLGCDHVQGFGIGKPMPFEDTLDWMRAHSAKLESAPKIIGQRFR